jgi:hypothetical protein
MSLPNDLKPSTIAAQAGGVIDMPSGGVVPPVQPSTTFVRDEDYALVNPDNIYSRDNSDIVRITEDVLARLEGAEEALLFPSGMAAIAALFRTLPNGATVVVQSGIYWGTTKWLRDFSARRQIALHEIDASDASALEQACSAHKPDLVFIETPSNPWLKSVDITHAAKCAHASGGLLAVDSTAATPVLQKPLELGADIVMHSATKGINGHSLDHHLLDLGDRLGRVQALGAGLGAVHDGVAAIEPERILQIVQPLARRLVAAVDQPAIGMQQRRRAEIAVAVPPVARAGGRAAGAQDALVEPVELLAVLDGDCAIPWRAVAVFVSATARSSVLGVEMRQVRHQVLHHRHVRQRIDLHVALDLVDALGAGQRVGARRCSWRRSRRCPRGRTGGRSASVDPGQRVLAPVLVVAVGVVLAGMGAAAFLARLGAETMVASALGIRLVSSSVSIRSEFQISDRSVTLMSSILPATPLIFSTPSASVSCRCGTRRRRPAWSSASRAAARRWACRHRRGAARRSGPWPSRSRPGWHVRGAAGVDDLAARIAAARPKTTRSISELEPSRLAPCTEAQPPRPRPSGPGTMRRGRPSVGFSTSPQ